MNNKRGIILVCIGVILIMFSIGFHTYNIYENKQALKKSTEIYGKIQNILLKVEEENINNEPLNIDGNTYIGTIEIPTLNLELPIMNDWSNEKMKFAPCRYYGSIYTNDLVLCSHSYDNLLGNIKDLNIDDIIIITDLMGNKILYKVEVVEVLSPGDIKEMIESEFDLTLFTCTKDNLNRVTVRLNRV